jgi:nitronate monooxygenase
VTTGTSTPTDRARFDELVAVLRVPVIAAPMTGVSSLELMAAASAAGIGASFPVHNAGTVVELDRWLGELAAPGAAAAAGPVIPNLVVHRTNTLLAEELAVVVRHGVPAVITSVGSPRDVVGPLHDAGILVLSDVASLRHADRAVAAGADGLVLLSAGAGGQTGWANPLAFVRAVRSWWDGPLVLAGGVVDGASVLAAQVAGYDLVYMGTPFIATTESAAAPAYREAVVRASMDDIEILHATGLASSMIRSPDAGVPASDAPPTTAYDAAILRASGGPATRFSAGHSVVGVDAVVPVAELVARVAREYDAARAGLARWSR